MLEENPMSSGRGGSMQAKSRGFSLVELLVAVTIFGVMSTVILNLYVNVVRSTTSSEEVVEVQQGLRIALDQVARDIQMAGFLIPTAAPITDASTNQITMVTASAFNSFARISSNVTMLTTDTEKLFTVDNAAMADLFRKDNYVRIINPMDGCQLSVADCDDSDGGAPLFKVKSDPGATSLTLEWVDSTDFGVIDAVTIDAQAFAGSMIVRVPSPSDDATYPSVVTYQLEDDPASTDVNMKVLSRIWATGLTINEKIIATNVSGLSFEYLMDDGTVETAVVANRLDKIVGVRILLTGLTEDAKTRGSKIRELQTTVKIRNI